MVQLHILSGRRTGTTFDAPCLPLTVGRSDQADLSLDEPGVWPAHCKILWLPEGLILQVEPNAFVSINGAPVERASLRNGDLLVLGGLTLRFSFSPTRQGSAAWREWLTWIGIALLCLLQVAAVYLLDR
ncbi:MAG TPA: FHA domain-containing protein [Candidatus Saccharimonadales bacterium]|nr:FHA domain-containing protein [Candidatus Saccharimonadales bacterium]